MKVTKLWAGKESEEISQERRVGGLKGELVDLKWSDLEIHGNFPILIE